MERITGRRNPVVTDIKKLKKRAARETLGLAFVEGRRLVLEAIAASGSGKGNTTRAGNNSKPFKIRIICVSESFARGGGFPEIDNAAEGGGFRFIEFPDDVFGAFSDTKNPQGILAVVETPEYSLDEIITGARGPLRLIMLDNVADPGNAGGILRTAWAAGFSGTVFSAGCVDAYEPKVIRASMGGIFHLPFIRGADLTEVIGILRNNGCKVYASSAVAGGDADAEDAEPSPEVRKRSREPGMRLPESLDCFGGAYGFGSAAIVIGGEARGVGGEIIALCDGLLSIPMPGGAESLNAGVAAGILMYEFVRRDIHRF